MERIGDITVERPSPRSVVVYIKQDDDVIVVYGDEVVGLAYALRKCLPTPVEEPDPSPEKWYVAFKNSNSRLRNRDDEPIMFTSYRAADAYGNKLGGDEERYCPISVYEYELTFGR